MTRNCSRCGKDFEALGQSHICEACKSPSNPTPRRMPLAAVKPSDLTFRERQVVAMVACGHINKEIAYQLHLSEGTIKQYLDRIYKKTKAQGRTKLALWWERQTGEKAIEKQFERDCKECVIRQLWLAAQEKKKENGEV